MAEQSPLYLPGATQTWTASAAITGGQLLVVSGNGTVAPSSGASAACIGVAGNDAANGTPVTVLAGGVQKIVAGTGGVTAGQTVESATGGTVVAHTNGTNDGNIVGVAVTTATATNVAYIQMER